MSRWAWRLLRRDWKQHVLIFLLLSVAVAGAVGLACAAHNIAPASGRADFGDADHSLKLDDDLDAATRQAQLDAIVEHFGVVDPIGHRPVPVPGTVRQVDYRVQDPTGPFGGPLLDLRSGRYPTADDEAAVTDWIAGTVGAEVGATIALDGVTRTVVGIVENPSDFDDEFVLLPNSALAGSDEVTVLIRAGEQQIRTLELPGGGVRQVSARGDQPDDLIAAMITLVVTTVVLLLVALVAAASFTVIAQRRLPQLGMMSAVGASEKHLRLTMVATGMVTGVVSALSGALIGLAGWFVLAPRMADAVGYRIDESNVPVVLIVLTLLLASLAATGAAWWPGRTMSRIPTVAALSGRPPRPSRLHRSALLAVTLLVGGVVCLTIGGRARQSASTTQIVLIIVGIVAVLAGVMLIGPIAIRGVARCAGRVPISARLAIRDLSRYQARSGAALAATALAIGIPVAIVASTAAAENKVRLGNLSSTQLLIHSADLEGPFVPNDSAVAATQPGIDEITGELKGATVIALSVVTSADLPTARDGKNQTAIALGRPTDRGWNDIGLLYVASPEILSLYGLTTADMGSGTDILTDQTGGVIDIIDVGTPRSRAQDEVEHLASWGSLPHTYDSLPHALINPAHLVERGWRSVRSGQWLVQTTKQLTSAELERVRVIAAQHGLRVESRRDSHPALANLRLGAVSVGMLLALGILTMTVGLIRAESAGDVRTLTATGATSATRRNITAVTSGGLAGLAAVLGTTGAYLALSSGRVSSLTPLPVRDLSVMVVGTPLLAGAVGWLIAGREPPVLARRPLG